MPPRSAPTATPAAEEEAIFEHYGLTYEQGASGERRLARR